MLQEVITVCSFLFHLELGHCFRPPLCCNNVTYSELMIPRRSATLEDMALRAEHLPGGQPGSPMLEDMALRAEHLPGGQPGSPMLEDMALRAEHLPGGQPGSPMLEDRDLRADHLSGCRPGYPPMLEDMALRAEHLPGGQPGSNMLEDRDLRAEHLPGFRPGSPMLEDRDLRAEHLPGCRPGSNMLEDRDLRAEHLPGYRPGSSMLEDRDLRAEHLPGGQPGSNMLEDRDLRADHLPGFRPGSPMLEDRDLRAEHLPGCRPGSNMLEDRDLRAEHLPGYRPGSSMLEDRDLRAEHLPGCQPGSSMLEDRRDLRAEHLPGCRPGSSMLEDRRDLRAEHLPGCRPGSHMLERAEHLPGCRPGSSQDVSSSMSASNCTWEGPEGLSFALCTKSSELSSQRMDHGVKEMRGPMMFSNEEGPILSAAPAGPWGHSIYSSFTYMLSELIHRRRRRSTLTRYNPGRTLPQVQSVTNPSAFGVKFSKCAQVKFGTDPPQLTFFLRVHNIGPVGGTNLTQVAIRDSISGIVPVKTEGKVVETGYQTFAIDFLPAGSQHDVNYTARIKANKNEVLDLPAFLTFSNASQNDVSMFGPLMANLTLRVNSTDRIYPNHGVHFAGFVGGFFVTLTLLSLGYLAMNILCVRTRLNLLQQRKRRGDSDPEYADSNMSETAKDEAAFEDKMVDVMVLEDPQNMSQALENLEMSSLLRATTNLEATRVQIYKDAMAALLGSLRSQGKASAQAQQRLLSVLHGQLLGMEGRLKEERGARMAALAGQCNLETREEMEVEHHREAAEKARAELLCQHADQQELLQCSVLLERLHKLTQSQLQRALLVRHEEASAKVQRHIVEWRRVELHKIFSEELEEATRMGELDKSTTKSLQHQYFTCQDQLEEVLDVVLANQRCMLAERHAQRKFLVHSLQSLKGLISDTFSNTSNNLDNWFNHIKRGGSVPAEQIEQLQDKAQKDLVLVRQRLEDALNQERRAMHCGLVKKRRELISDMLQSHKQRQRDLSGLSKSLEETVDIAQHLHCWQSLLTSQSLELAELINNLDEEAAADIRKVTMRVLQTAMAEVKSIQPSATQVLLTLWPPGTPRSLLQLEPESGSGQGQGGQGGSALLQAQERLHQEGKSAVHTLRCTREALQEAMERELQEQKEIRAKGRAFFRCLCSSQLTLSEDDMLRMKLEFQKCLSVMDRCLVLPHAVSRAKLHSALSAWRKDMHGQTEKSHTQKKTHSKGKSSEARHKADPSELLVFHQRLEDRIQLLDKEKEMESSVMDKVLEEMQKDRDSELHSQADGLAMQMAAIYYQKAERRTKVLETSKAMLTLHSVLPQQLREGKHLETQDLAQSIQNHCAGLEEADQQLQKERAELDCLEKAQPREKQASNSDEEGEEEEEEERVFQVQQDYRMATILQEALYKCDQVFLLLADRLQGLTTRGQATEDLKEQLELKRLYANCDQDLDFASQLVRQSQLSTDVLLEALRLLLPTLPESELLSIIDALCPKQPPVSCSSEQEPSGCPEGSSRTMLVKLRKDIVVRNMLSHNMDNKDRHRLQEKRPNLMEKLFHSPRLEALRDVIPVLVEEKQKDGDPPDIQQPVNKSSIQQRQHTVTEGVVEADATTSTRSSSTILGIPATGERVFVFRDPPESHDRVVAPRRKRKRNFLNLKKGSVAPTTCLH